MKWWEKTVEYYFVRSYLSNSAIAPLDGNEELAGDAIYEQAGKLILIEFKRDVNSINSERNKFDNFISAQECLKNEDGHHYIIFGINDNGFEIKARTYFSENGKEIKNAINNGVKYKKFNEYLNKLLGFKKKKDGGGIGSYEIVAMVGDNGEVISCVSLEEYVMRHSQEIDFSQEITSDSELDNSPGMRM